MGKINLTTRNILCIIGSIILCGYTYPQKRESLLTLFEKKINTLSIPFSSIDTFELLKKDFKDYAIDFNPADEEVFLVYQLSINDHPSKNDQENPAILPVDPDLNDCHVTNNNLASVICSINNSENNTL